MKGGEEKRKKKEGEVKEGMPPNGNSYIRAWSRQVIEVDK